MNSMITPNTNATRNAHRHGQQIQAVRPLIDVIAGNDGQQMPIAHAHRRIAEIRTDAVVLRKNDALLPLFEPRPQNVDRLFDLIADVL